MSEENGQTVRSSFEHVPGWGGAVGANSRVLRPRTVDEIRACFELARREGRTLGPRGSGCSYGDASVNDAGHVLELSGLDRLLDFDAQTGVATCEAGVTIQKLWKSILPHGWWPRVVSGTMFPTLAGALSANIHGKNNFAVGTIGDAVREFDILLPRGDLLTCSRDQESDLFHAAIGGFGMLGIFTRIALNTKRVYSGDLEVRAFANKNLREMMDYIEDHKEVSDYLVGWIDCFTGGDALGRGLIHDARYLKPGEDLEPEETLRIEHQELPSKMFGVLPKSEVWRFLRPFVNDPGCRFINAVKYWMGRVEGMGDPYRLSHAGFAFLLDYVPNWKWAYGRGGLIQYQVFLPADVAHEVYSEILRRCQAAHVVPYLGVFKRHRPDPFWLTHAVDGWSFALDFRVTDAGRDRLWKHCDELTELVLEAGGRFYFAKDLVIDRADVERMFPPDRLEAFLELKRRCDPEGLLETTLWRRAMPPVRD